MTSDIGPTPETLVPSAGEELVEAQPTSPESGDIRGRIRARLWPMFAGMGGIDDWLVKDQTPSTVFERLAAIESEPLSRAQLSQLLILSHQAGMSAGFFDFYWKTAPALHIYDVSRVGDVEFDSAWVSKDEIASLNHLKWGFLRFYVDALLCFGNIRAAYRTLRELTSQEIASFFQSRRIDTAALASRGAALPLKSIARDNRYLIAEVACKTLEGGPRADILMALTEAYERHVASGGSPVVSVEELLSGEFLSPEFVGRQAQLQFSADDILEQTVESVEDLKSKVSKHQETFSNARDAALENTRLYLSMVEELDVYVATSMRTRKDFRDMASFCDDVFADDGLHALAVRYFDPTMSAANGHVDKGLIECLMVQAAKLLVYYAGERESLGKDAEFTMALSQGKPVVIFCESPEREAFYRDVHPLTRLIDFRTGVPVGAMVTTSRETVATLLNRVLRNEMEYDLLQTRAAETQAGFLALKERLTGSILRLQTSDAMLQETFWNYYHRQSTPLTGD